MKACKVLKTLKITRPTLCKYVKTGKLRVNALPSGVYDYDDESVYEILNGNKKRKVIVYIGKCVVGNDIDIIVERIRKDHIGEDVEVIRDTNGLFGAGFEQLIVNVLNHSVKKVVVLKDDFETLNALSVFEKTIKICDCSLQIVDSDSKSDEWKTENIERLLNLLKMKFESETDQKIKDKLFCCWKILRM